MRGHRAKLSVARVPHHQLAAMSDIPMTKNTLAVMNVERELERVHARLLASTKHLAESMTRLAERIEREGVEARVNELGEVQSLGPDIDRLCALLHVARETRNLVRRMAAP
jgi:hypothetical protein